MLMDPSAYSSFQADPAADILNFDLTTALEFLSELPLPSPPPPPPVQLLRHSSAFHKYVSSPNSRCFQPPASSNGNKLQKRVIAMLRNMKRTRTVENNRESGTAESSRGFRHMIRERQRREKLSQSYADLYAMLSSRSKGDKNSIVQSAAMYLRELKGVKEQLHRKNEELKATILGIDASTEGIKVKFEVANPNSGLDSMIAALRRLQSMDVKAKAIRSDLSSGGLATTMTIQTKMAACEVEKEIEAALQEVQVQRDSSYPVMFPGNNNTWSQSRNSHMENVF